MRTEPCDYVAVRYELLGDRRLHARQTLRVGEAVRLYALGRYGRMFGEQGSATLSGHEGAAPARGHRHVHYLPTDEDDDGVIDHVTIYAPVGFNVRELKALQRLTYLPQARDAELRLKFLAFLRPEELARTLYFVPAVRWRSVTPMVPYRHPKKHRRGEPKLNEAGRQIDGPEDQLHGSGLFAPATRNLKRVPIGGEATARCVKAAAATHWPPPKADPTPAQTAARSSSRDG